MPHDIRKIPPEKLRGHCRPEDLTFESTEEIPDPGSAVRTGLAFQPRAREALQFGVSVRGRGHHLFVTGGRRLGRRQAVLTFLEEVARKSPPPVDYAYLFNFKDPDRPKAVPLPHGMGRALARDMDEFIRDLRREVPKAFEHEEYQRRRQELNDRAQSKRRQAIKSLADEVTQKGYILRETPAAFVTVAALDGEPLTEDAYSKLPEHLKQDVSRRGEVVQERVRARMREIRSVERELEESTSSLDREVGLLAVEHLIDRLRERYSGISRIQTHLTEVQEDVIDHLERLRKAVDGLPPPFAALVPDASERIYDRYRVNPFLVDNDHGAPVVFEIRPTFPNLFGRVERKVQLGALVTDFTLLRPGALHRANGGYLVMFVHDLAAYPGSYEMLKQSLRAGEVRIEELASQFGFTSAEVLKPEPIPLDVKVVLIGEPWQYFLLHSLDPDVRQLFQVRVDFDAAVDASVENVRRYAGYVAEVCRSEKMKPLDRGAVGRLVEHAMRVAGDQRKLTARLPLLRDLVLESQHFAGDGGPVTAEAVRRAIEHREYRSNLVLDHLKEAVARGVLIVNTTGQQVGQMNGLSVSPLGDFTLGRPVRVTATVGLGRGGVVDIERRAQLGGRIYSKGVMILAGFLEGRFAAQLPLALTASLCFEQSYGEIEGDSASSVELYSLLSTLSDLPLRQGLAATGAVSQAGEVQPIGAVTEKIEGFFDVCRTVGLTGDQGVIIPARNIEHLNLREDVCEAIERGQFHLYPVYTVDEGMAVLTGEEPGERLADGSFTVGSINDRVAKRLEAMAEEMRHFAQPPVEVAEGPQPAEPILH